MGDDVRVVRGVLGVGLGLTGSSEPIDFVRDRGVRDGGEGANLERQVCARQGDGVTKPGVPEGVSVQQVEG